MIPLQGNGKFARGAYYVAGHLLRMIVLSPIVNKYIVRKTNMPRIGFDLTRKDKSGFAMTYLGSWRSCNFSLEKCISSLSKTSVPEDLFKDRG